MKIGKKVIILDNFSNSKMNTIENIKKITEKKLIFYKADIKKISDLDEIFSSNIIDSVIHFAGLKSVSESIQKPDLYHENNVTGTENILNCMNLYNVKKLIFSSSATVYGDPKKLPIYESHPLNPNNPYGKSKLDAENLIKNFINQNKSLSCVSLRYFNPIGAHSSGLIGEDGKGNPSNIMPLICRAAANKIKKIKIYGNDYPTPDGTGIRDYIHVYDLIKAHLSSLTYLSSQSGFISINIGTGHGFSVFELINAFKTVNKVEVPYIISRRRQGDVAKVYCNNSLALKLLKWKPTKDIKNMVLDSWHSYID